MMIMMVFMNNDYHDQDYDQDGQDDGDDGDSLNIGCILQTSCRRRIIYLGDAHDIFWMMMMMTMMEMMRRSMMMMQM